MKVQFLTDHGIAARQLETLPRVGDEVSFNFTGTHYEIYVVTRVAWHFGPPDCGNWHSEDAPTVLVTMLMLRKSPPEP